MLPKLSILLLLFVFVGCTHQLGDKPQGNIPTEIPPGEAPENRPEASIKQADVGEQKQLERHELPSKQKRVTEFFQQKEERKHWDTLTDKEREILPKCTDELITQPPVAYDSIAIIEPIGEASPPEHTLASISTDTYIAVKGTVELVAPADMWLIFAQKRHGITQDGEDHILKYAFCKDVYGIVDHVKGFSPYIEELLANSSCTYSSGEDCPKLLLEFIKAGTPLGYVGGQQGNFNFGVWDLRKTNFFIRPDRHGFRSLHSACPFDYYSQEWKQKMLDKIQRKDSEKCGKVDYDVPGTLQGDWFIDDASVTRPADWPKLLFLGTDNDFPESGLIVVSGMFVDKPTKWFFKPEQVGRINRIFDEIRDNYIYCYESNKEFRNYAKGVDSGRIVIQLVNETELKIEHQSKSCDARDWEFFSPTTYIR